MMSIVFGRDGACAGLGPAHLDRRVERWAGVASGGRGTDGRGRGATGRGRVAWGLISGMIGPDGRVGVLRFAPVMNGQNIAGKRWGGCFTEWKGQRGRKETPQAGVAS
jgi:hypothetical protein